MRNMMMTTSKLGLSRLGMAALLVLALGVTACGKKPIAATDDRKGARVVRASSVEMRRLAGGLTSSGLLISREEAAVNSELSGYRVAKVFVEVDARVAQGQPLAQLDDTLLQSQIAQQTALVAQQQVAADQAASQAKDVEGLDTQGVLSKEQIDQRRYAARSAHAALEAQLAQLHDLQTREARMTIRAPVGGLVLERNIRPGDVASPSAATPMFRMARDSLVELEAAVAEGDLGGVHVGDLVQVDLPDGAAVVGRVRLISPSVDPQTKLGKIRVSLPVRDDLRPGGFGRATFSGSTVPVLSVPESAIRYDADGASVMVIDSTDHVHQIPVKTGAHGGGYVQLVQGPPAGSRVLQGAAVFVLPGDAVKPIQDGR
jgi:HlyD family secretion protein